MSDQYLQIVILFAMVQRLSLRRANLGVVSSIPPAAVKVHIIYYRDTMGKYDDNGDVRKVAVAFCCVFSSRYLNLC